MKKKKLIIVLLSVVIVIVGIIGICYYRENMYNGDYVIKTKLVDDKSPDRILIVYRNEKETNKYKFIKFKDKDNIILCYQKNPAVNKFELKNVTELVVVLPNDKEVIAKVELEEEI